MEFIDNLKKLKLKENFIFLFLITWLLIAYAVMAISNLFNMPIIGLFVYFPLLAFTLFLWFISLFRKGIRDISKRKFILLLFLDFALMIIFVFAVIIILIISIFSYVFLTSYFLLYGCYKAGKRADEKLFYKRYSWFWRRLEFWGGLVASLTLLIFFTLATYTATTITGVTVLILIAYLAVILVIVFFAIYSLIQTLFKRRLNAWLGTYFIFITGYILYLVLKVFINLYGGTGEETPIHYNIVLIFLDLMILLYSIGSILGSKGEILAEKIKVFEIDTALLWLIFSKAAWEFAVNYPYGIFGGPQALGIENVSELGAIITLIANTIILAIFFFLIIIFGFYGMSKYAEEQARLKVSKKDVDIARISGQRKDDSVKKKNKIILSPEKSEEEKNDEQNMNNLENPE